MNLRPIHRRARARRTWRVGQARQGMVLFEVVIALFIFTMVAFSLVLALDRTFDAATDRNEIDVATRGLENQMELLHAAPLLPGAQDLTDDGSGVLYHLDVEQEQMQDEKMRPVANMWRATITATWTSHGQAQERDVSELVYQP